jgi:hypothetical protein
MDFTAHLAQADSAVVARLGGPVRYTSSGFTAVDVTGIFDAAYVLVDAGQAGVSSFGPAVFLRLSDLPSDPSEDDPRIEIDGVQYQVREAKPDGLGGVLLLLHAV